MKSFFPPLAKAFTSPRTIKTYSGALLTLRRLINKKAQREGHTQLSRIKINAAGTYSLSILYSYDLPGWGLLRIVTPENQTIFRADIDSLSRYRRWLLHLPMGTFDLLFETTGGEGLPIFYAIGTTTVRQQPKAIHADIDSNTICAAIATYPQRREMLKDAVASLAFQVDHLFVYLNNYREPPSFLLQKIYRGRVHFILDTNSSYRAAAKFFWLNKHICYWLLCDDDIIYPANYAKTIKAKIDQYGRRSIVGIHGTIFEHTSHEHLLHHRILFAEALDRDREVHMLGTGTLALHSSNLSRADCQRLLRHPIANDEVMAVICRARRIRQISIRRSDHWLRSNPRMTYGIFEETQLHPGHFQRNARILRCGAPWPQLAIPAALKEATD